MRLIAMHLPDTAAAATTVEAAKNAPDGKCLLFLSIYLTWGRPLYPHNTSQHSEMLFWDLLGNDDFTTYKFRNALEKDCQGSEMVHQATTRSPIDRSKCYKRHPQNNFALFSLFTVLHVSNIRFFGI